MSLTSLRRSFYKNYSMGLIQWKKRKNRRNRKRNRKYWNQKERDFMKKAKIK